ncbi:hypothetical protein [Cellulomonas chengniuliangii]|uniref:Uncharacterized protein n=1 Tax=Cellulomonas chengniuliangii TaxID=2968084 RepID=A0ABY5L520_9CELL|nr:hypothetical protein [Cellulomonas chengniuliangii]MCC2307531.1 hypothetical protein [Cellulomonas chengniuliangii]UUI75698.1 hypothetical protein NP064_01895 [Cellulomonas chengniuliangii]
MSIQLYGHWDLHVVEAVHTWENRYRVEGAASGSGAYPGDVGSQVTADGAAWALVAEHRENASATWKPSDMMIDPGLDRVDVRATIGAEDPLPTPDFRDLRWDARYLGGTLFEAPYRPYAVRPDDLFEMPDGIFEAALGVYLMGVRVINRWGLPFTDTHVLDISAGSRSDLAMRGVRILDSWSQAELASLGQRQLGTGMVLGPLVPGAGKTVYFKVDVRDAAPRKHEVELVCRNLAGMADAGHPARRVRTQIFVSRTSVDPATGEIVSRVQEGTLRMRLREFALDQVNGRKARRDCPPPRRGSTAGTRAVAGSAASVEQRDLLRRALQALLDGRPVDPCLIREILECACASRPGAGHHCDGNGGPRDPGGGRCDDPFYAFPTKFSYTVTPRAPFPGQYGPIPFDDPWWKVLLLIIALLLLIAGALVEAADVAYQDEDLVIGTLGRVRRDDVDAALCVIDTDRALAFLTTLDAQSNEDSQNAVTALDGDITLTAPVMTRAELDAIMVLPASDPQRKVHKSGARTGLTHAIMTGFAPLGHGLASWSIDQLTLETDPDFNELVSQPGDSGSIWVHTATLRPVALHHSGDGSGVLARASLLDDVQGLMDITISG